MAAAIVSARVEPREAERGVQWHVACLEAAEPLAASDRIKGTDQWRHSHIRFEVADAAWPVHALRL